MKDKELGVVSLGTENGEKKAMVKSLTNGTEKFKDLGVDTLERWK